MMSSPTTLNTAIRPEVAEIIDTMIEVRRDFHRHPEIGMQCHRTAKIAADLLKSWGCDEVVENIAQSGVVAIIQGALPGPDVIVGYRADIDALPLLEKSARPWSSTISGCMHGCGHDGHAATALTIAYALTRSRQFPGRAMIILQPGEEGYAGARQMIEAGLFTRWPAREVYATHGAVDVPVGSYAIARGPSMAAADLFHIEIIGKGGHGGRPQECIDPVVMAADLILSAQTIASRNISPMRPGVVSISSIQGGNPNGHSVVPQTVKLSGTTRCSTPEDRDLIESRLNAICQGVALKYGGQVSLNYVRMYPPLCNHDAQVDAAAAVIESIVGKERLSLNYPAAMGAEDFSFMLEKVPGCYIKVGTGDADHTATQHNPYFDFNDLSIAPAASIMTTLIESRLKVLSAGLTCE